MLPAGGRDATLVIRRATPADTNGILRMLDRDWRVHLRVLPDDVGEKLRTELGLVVEDGVGLRGFLLVAPQPMHSGLLIGAGLRDTWKTALFLDLLLPRLEAEARRAGLRALSQIGNAPWLTDELTNRGFRIREWIVTFEWEGTYVPRVDPAIPLRPAHRRDLPGLLDLDQLAFGPNWRKAPASFSEALARATSFSVAELDGQIVGYQWSDQFGVYGHLTRLATHPAFQGRGIGTTLVAQALHDLIDAGARHITLNTQEANLRSQALYRRCGFVRTDQRVAVLWKDLA